MKRIFLILAGILIASSCYAETITIPAIVTPDDVTIDWLASLRSTYGNALNSFPGENIRSASISTESMTANANPENRWNEAFNDFVYTGLLPATAAALISDISSGTAYVEGVRVVKDTTSHTYTANKWTFVDLSKTGTYTFNETAQGAAEPATTTSSIRLARVSTNATIIGEVRDDRVTSLSVSNKEDFQRSGMYIRVTSPDVVYVGPGVVYHGTSRLSKVTATALVLGTAVDWITGVSQRAVSTDGWIAINSAGSIKLTATAPTLADTSSNAEGKLRYINQNSELHRVLAWFKMNDEGSGGIDTWGYSDNSDTSTINTVTHTYNNYFTNTVTIPADDSKPQITEGMQIMTIDFTPTSATSTIKVEAQALLGSGTDGLMTIALFKDAGANAIATMSQTIETSGADRSVVVPLTCYFKTGSTASFFLQVRAGLDSSNAIYFNGDTTARLFQQTAASYITVTELDSSKL